jgi:single-strand DNA-binding protein
MSIGDTTLTVVGNLTKDPEVRFLPTGAAVASFTVAASRRGFDQQRNEWKDGDTLFLRCSAWRQLAEHIGDTLNRGDRVVATGRLKQREYEVDNVKRTVFELDVEDIGASLKYATASIKKAARGDAGVPHPADDHTTQGAGSGGWGTTDPGANHWPTDGDAPPF